MFPALYSLSFLPGFRIGAPVLLSWVGPGSLAKSLSRGLGGRHAPRCPRGLRRTWVMDIPAEPAPGSQGSEGSKEEAGKLSWHREHGFSRAAG